MRQLTRVFPFVIVMSLYFDCAFAAEESAKPNILVILVDDLGYGDLSSYGATDLQSPNIDALAKSGKRFDNFYANCPVCSPTRASILTGRYPEEVGVPGVIRTHPQDSWGFLDPNAKMLPTTLKAAGYHTAAVGKWHLGMESPSLPNERGFDHFHGFLGDMMDDYYNHRRHDINYLRKNRETIAPEGHATDLFSDWACEYISSQKSQSDPFFLYLAYNAPHTPIQPPQDWLDKVKARQPGISDRRAKLVALIEHCDDGIGKVITRLKETDQYENTLTIFVSDNGGQSGAGANNGGLRDGKQSMYEGGIRVPMCAVWPGKIAAGSESSMRGITMDIFPTVCQAASAEVDAAVDGVSLLDLLTGKTAAIPDRDLFFHRREGNNRYAGLTINALISGEWKLLQNSPFQPLELYHLAKDPTEQTNLADKNKERFHELATKLRRQVQMGGRVPWQRPN